MRDNLERLGAAGAQVVAVARYDEDKVAGFFARALGVRSSRSQ